jgi:hypothetical protein
MRTQLHLLVAIPAIALSGCRSKPTLPTNQHATPRTKEVLIRENGQDRHWVIRVGGLIVEEHGLAAHGDFHLVLEYPKGVHSPQVDSKEQEENVESVMKVFWPNGTVISETQQLGQKANGRDTVWWPNGKTAREASYVRGSPVGVWKFYDISGKFVGEGSHEDGKPWRGVFVGNGRPGIDFLESGLIEKQTFEGGVLKREETFLEDDFLKKHFSAEINRSAPP